MTAVFTIIEIIGIISFAIAGAIEAINKETDLFGVVFLSIITTFGGGMIRDVMLNQIPVFFTSYLYVTICIFTSLAVFFIAAVIKNKFVENEALIDRINNVFDAMGIGAFAVSGAKLSMELGHDSFFIVVIMGMITCVGGSMIRSFRLRDIPFILRKRVYALAALSGGACYWIMVRFHANEIAAMLISMVLVFAIRMLATIFKWNFPKAIDFGKLKASEKITEDNSDE